MAIFQDLCQLVNADQPFWLNGMTEMTRTFGLELLEAVLTSYPTVFTQVGWSDCLSGLCQGVCLTVKVFVCLTLCLSLSGCLSDCQGVCLSDSLSRCLSV